jgi:hypothetical protein
MKLIKLGFTKMAKGEKNAPPSLKLPKPVSLIDSPNKIVGREIVDKQINTAITKPWKPTNPITRKIISSISKDVQSYASGNKKVWDDKFKKFEKQIKDPKKVLGGVAVAGLYFAGKKHPKLENAVNVLKERKFNIINKPKQKLSFSVPKNKKGTWGLNWSKTF